MNDIQTVVLLNNEAVQLLTFGAPARAYKTFKSALLALNNLDPAQHFQNNSLLSKPKIGSRSILQSRSKDNEKGWKSMKISSIVIPAKNEVGYFVYSRPFVFNLDDTTHGIHFYSAAIMFNMALTLQSRDKDTFDKAKNSALRLYDVVISILEEASNISECKGVWVAALNNKSQIHYELSHFDEARKGLGMLISAIRSPENRSSFDQEDIEQFLLNEMLLKNSATARAA